MLWSEICQGDDERSEKGGLLLLECNVSPLSGVCNYVSYDMQIKIKDSDS